MVSANVGPDHHSSKELDPMAIRDLLWACPACARIGALAGSGREAVCSFCGASFRRASGALIVASKPEGIAEVRSPGEWEDLLPALDTPVERGRLGPQAVLARWAHRPRAVRHRGQFLGWAESFGPQTAGTASLDPLKFKLQLKETAFEWPFETITAVQPSSATLQINGSGHPLVSVRFLEDSVRRWEALLQHAIRNRIRQLGRGEVFQFHPRIRCG